MNNIKSILIDYKTHKTPLCEIGRIHDTDKSSQRDNVNISINRFCHPYTIFYNNLFRSKKDEHLEIAEIGVWQGASLLMWRDYFSNSNIYGFDNNVYLMNQFLHTQNTERIRLSYIDVSNRESITNSLRSFNVSYDVIIDDSSHIFDHEINIIENTYQFLKPGGVLIIEDIYPYYTDQHFIERLQPILHNFQDYYFIKIDHVNKNSGNYDNDKLFVLVKNGGEPIFRPYIF